jgi:DNA repair exonuclease SbcCD nuclease subunit
VLHSSAEDPGEHETYAPCRIEALAAKGYDYWALGHIHQRRVLHERPFIVFPGNLQGRHAKETGAKGCTLVTVENGEIAAVEHRSVDVLRWAAVEVDAAGLATAAALDARLAEAVRAAAAEADGRPVLARVTLTGATPLHGALLGDADRLAAECRAAALAADADLWVEKISLRTRPVAAGQQGDEALAALRAAFLAALEDRAVAEPLLAEIERLRGVLPPEAREGLDLPEGIGGLDLMAEDAWAIIAAALAEEAPPA